MQLTSDEELTLKTYNIFAKLWSKNHATVGFWKKEMETFKRLLPTGKILEIGSGGGRDAKELIELGYEYIGTDISPSLIEVAKSENPRITFLKQSVYDLDFPKDYQFDGFWASAVLLHIPKTKIDHALQSIRRVIKHDGVGFIALKKGIGEKVEERLIDQANDKRFFAYYSEQEFTDILRRNNFEVVSMSINSMSEKTTWLCFFVKVIK